MGVMDGAPIDRRTFGAWFVSVEGEPDVTACAMERRKGFFLTSIQLLILWISTKYPYTNKRISTVISPSKPPA